jgi:DNA-binding CsgD family transcriptional regulator
MTALGRPMEAVRSFGAAERMRQEFRVVAASAAAAAALASARAELGEAAFSEAWAVGWAVPYEQAVADALAEALAAAATGAAAARPVGAGHGLTPREVEVLGLVAAGKSDREIAEVLSVSPRTAAHHVANILAKLGVASRAAAAAHAVRHGLA